MHFNESATNLAMPAPRERIPSPDLEPAAHPDPGSQPDPPPPEPGNYPDFSSSESSGSRGPSPGPNDELPYDNDTALRTEIPGLVQFDDAVNELDRTFKRILRDLDRLRSLALKEVAAGGTADGAIGEAMILLGNIRLEDEGHDLRRIVLKARIGVLEQRVRTGYDLEPYHQELESVEKALEKDCPKLDVESDLWNRLGKLKEKKLQKDLGGEAYAKLQANRRWQQEQERRNAGKGRIKCACCPAAASEGLTSEELLGMIQGI